MPPFRPQRLLQQLALPGSIRPLGAARATTQRSIYSSSLAKAQSRQGGICTVCQRRFRPSTATQYSARQVHRFASSGGANTDDASTTIEQDATIPKQPDLTNHYTIFPLSIPGGPPPGSPFHIPAGELRWEFLQLQSAFHPDKYPSGPAKLRAEALSARLNEAYRTLADPLRRAQYLLRDMHGVDVTAEDGARQHSLDQELLMEVMAVSEVIEEIADDPKAGEVIQRMKGENGGRIEGSIEALAAAFDGGDLEAARKECVRLRFWYSVDEGLKEWEPGMTEIRLMH